MFSDVIVIMISGNNCISVLSVIWTTVICAYTLFCVYCECLYCMYFYHIFCLLLNLWKPRGEIFRTRNSRSAICGDAVPQFAEAPFCNLRRLRLVYSYLLGILLCTVYSTERLYLSRKMWAAICGDLRLKMQARNSRRPSSAICGPAIRWDSDNIILNALQVSLEETKSKHNLII